ncbi:uncharacterized protein PAC_07660 [Phialocephala subalpina]|uniref:DUF1907 domain-containing protein n=1 Tax=Phialocephala subalpina TaxID=576137 RepID=A0A1L7WYC4_9HELO|nr:uncharacterized protein PAC_07660 [Phialocephala subalpina]
MPSSTSTLPIKSLPIEKHALDPPPLVELASVISKGLQANYKSSTVSIIPCPDLTASPFHLAAPGLSGHESIADIGGPPFLHPLPDFSKKYSLPDILSHCGDGEKGGRFAIGAGAGPFHVVGQNSELAPNISVDGDGEVNNLTKYAKIGKNGEVISGPVPEGSTDCCLMANLFISSGLPGNVLKITAKSELAPNISVDGDGEVNNLTKYAKIGKNGEVISGPVPEGSTDCCLMANLFISSGLPGNVLKITAKKTWSNGCDSSTWLGLRMEHTHCFANGKGKDGKGGHYHGDTEDTKDEVEYEGYFNIARIIYRIDRPGGGHE